MIVATTPLMNRRQRTPIAAKRDMEAFINRSADETEIYCPHADRLEYRLRLTWNTPSRGK